MIFKIRKGYHFSNNLIYKLFHSISLTDKLSYTIFFNETNKYIDETVDRFDINKLFGFSSGLHHKNSYRFGWNCIDGQIYIYAYSYINGVRTIDEICTVDLDKEYKFTIRLKNGKVMFTIIDSDYQIKQVVHIVNRKKSIGYTLWPYFGGNNTAPQNILIELI